MGLLLFMCSNPAPAADAPVARKLYVANTAGESLSLIDLDRREVVRELQVGKHPHGLAVAPDHSVIYCSVESERVIKFIDTTTDR